MLDQLIIQFDKILRTLYLETPSIRPHPGAHLQDLALTDNQKRHARGLMRVNHCGEICAQALYQGQALTAQQLNAKKALEKASNEETEHLAWTASRIHELGGKSSLLNPLWYIGSLTIGVGAGLFGDKWSLGFLEETENQVCIHLAGHLKLLPLNDLKSRAIVKQMLQEEKRHAKLAKRLGSAALPPPIKFAMQQMAKVMTRSSYYF